MEERSPPSAPSASTKPSTTLLQNILDNQVNELLELVALDIERSRTENDIKNRSSDFRGGRWVGYTEAAMLVRRFKRSPVTDENDEN